MTEAEERLIKAALVYTGNIAGGLTLEFVDAANAVRAERQPSPYAGPSFTHQQWRELYSAPLKGPQSAAIDAQRYADWERYTRSCHVSDADRKMMAAPDYQFAPSNWPRAKKEGTL